MVDGRAAVSLGTVPIADCAAPALTSLRSVSGGLPSAIARCSDDQISFITIDVSGSSARATVVGKLPSRYYEIAWNAQARSGWAAYQVLDCGAVGRFDADGLTSAADLPSSMFGWDVGADLLGPDQNGSTKLTGVGV
jgi:hypothetical protein